MLPVALGSRASLTGTSLRPFSPGTLVASFSKPLPTRPESEATGASPGAGASLWAGAFSAPRPLAVGFGQRGSVPPARFCWRRGGAGKNDVLWAWFFRKVSLAALLEPGVLEGAMVGGVGCDGYGRMAVRVVVAEELLAAAESMEEMQWEVRTVPLRSGLFSSAIYSPPLVFLLSRLGLALTSMARGR